MSDLNNNLQKKHVNIGLDIGTTSIGWAIIDNDYNVIDYGVRLFEDPCESNKETRRLRSSRRMLRRQKHRKDRFIQLIIDNKDIFSFNNKEEINEILKKEVELPWDVKVSGLRSQLSKEKLIYILHHYLSHRGKIYDDDETNKKSNQLFSNNLTKYPSEQQQETFRLNGFLPSWYLEKN